MFEPPRSLVHASPAPARCALALAALLGLFSGAAPGRAADGASEVFTVKDVTVDATAATAAAARDDALVGGGRLAFQRLLARLTLRRDERTLPKPSASELTDLIAGFEVQEEKNSPVRYIATLTYHFNPRAVEQLLRAANIGFAETPSKPIVVLPVLRSGGVLLLWDDPNPWRAAWANLPPADGLVPFSVPIGDANDLAEVTAETAAQGDAERLRALAARYGAGATLVAVATSRREAGTARGAVELAVSRYGAALQEQIKVASLVGEPGESLDALYARAAKAVESEVTERWKEDNLLHFDQAQQAVVSVPIGRLEDWLKIQQRLSDIATISRAEVVYLSRGEARVALSYFGDPTQLKLALAQRDLNLSEEGGALVLRLAGTGPGAAAQQAPAASP